MNKNKASAKRIFTACIAALLIATAFTACGENTDGTDNNLSKSSSIPTSDKNESQKSKDTTASEESQKTPEVVMGKTISSGKCGENVTYILDENGTLLISGTGEMEDHPSDGTEDIPWYLEKDKIKKVIIEPGVTSIGRCAFIDCISLESVAIPNSVTNIGGQAFDNTTWYNNQADGLVYAGKVLYKYKGEMPTNTSIEIKDGTLGIADFAFSGYGSLKNITIPDSVVNIGWNAFRSCESLTSIIIPSSVTNIEDGAFESCHSLTSVMIGNGVISIGKSTFYNCRLLESITIPDSVTNIGGQAFDDTAWYNNQKDGLVYAGKVLYKYKGEMPDNASIEIKDGTLGIADYAFQECSSLKKSVILPNSVTSIGDRAFENCTSLESITIPYSVKSIGNEAFANCGSLKSVTIPDGITNIGDRTFVNCSLLESITIPDSVTSIGRMAFLSCNSLENVTIGNGVESIGDSAFYGISLKNIDVSDRNSNYSSIDGVLFNKNKSKLIQYPAGKKDIEYTIPDSVTSIGDSAFEDQHFLVSLIYPDEERSSLKSVILPNSVTSIGDSAFENCTSLESITIPDSVTSIGYDAFRNCSDSLTIYGAKGSAAESYANDNDISFIAE